MKAGQAIRCLKSASLVVLVGCTGDPFFYAAPESANIPAANRLESSDTSQTGGSSSSSEQQPVEVVAAVEASPCGDLRIGDPDLENGEVCVADSTFTMGSGEPNFDSGFIVHGPEHQVTLSAFVLDAFEVTVGRFRECVEANACDAPLDVYEQGCTYSDLESPLDLLPVTCVTHTQARSFCQWDGGRSLPTEAQWERAARGEGSNDYPWEGPFQCSLAIVASRNQCQQYENLVPKKVGSAPDGATPEGAYDLIGNAAEWVADWGASFNSRPVQDPRGPDSGSLRVHKGGGWRTLLDKSAGYARGVADPESRSTLSFRCARSPVL